MNTYSYANGNPIRYVDPLGLNPATALEGAAIGGAIGGPPGALAGGIVGFGLGAWATHEAFNYFNKNGSKNSQEPESCPSSDPDNWDKIKGSKPPAYKPLGAK